MKRLLLVNTSVNSGSTGRIAEQIGQTAIAHGFESYFGYGRVGRVSQSHLIKIGAEWDVRFHGVESLLLDNHGFGSRHATRKFVEEIERIKPDIINLHNIHGYYLNIEILFGYLAKKDIPVVWTLHDCWPFTGHCAHYIRVQCDRWKRGCYCCPNRGIYPKSLFWDRSRRNYQVKRRFFTSLSNVTIVCPSQWLADDVRQSFLNCYDVKTIYNGVDVTVFRPLDTTSIRRRMGLPDKCRVVLGVASLWTSNKGLFDFYKLRETLGEGYQIIMIGLNENQINSLPRGIVGIRRTESVEQLAELYSLADVFVNPTYVDNFPTTNIEALACGTPVVTYRTGGSPEAIDEHTGLVIEQGNIRQLKNAIENIAPKKSFYTEACRKRAVEIFNMHERFSDYVKLFDQLIKS